MKLTNILLVYDGQLGPVHEKHQVSVRLHQDGVRWLQIYGELSIGFAEVKPGLYVRDVQGVAHGLDIGA